MWFIRKGFLWGIVNNLHNAFDEQYYTQLKHRLTAYQNVTPFQILDHLDGRWCPLDVKAKKALKNTYYSKWVSDEHLTAFGKCLDDDQKALVRSDVTIPNEDKLQFYLKQMYESNHFDKAKMLDWEKQSVAVKTNFACAKDYFKALVKATNTYKQNAGGSTTGHNKYKSANQMADYGNKICKYIAKIAGAAASNNTYTGTTTQVNAIAAQIKALTNTVTKLAAANENMNPNIGGGGRGSGSGNKSRRLQMKMLRNMGGYCHSHGFHPVSINHDSTTCSYKKGDHKTKAKWTNCLGGDINWPTAKRVAIEQ